ncbi:MAG: hypothetical protein LBI36_07625, partial [Oscillospiraceae bacterium]|jgi:hypothetical protein|nr:hypothetical protein [Oscillospiraceae bacterium]
VVAQIFDSGGFDAPRAFAFFLFGAAATGFGMLLSLPAAVIKKDGALRVWNAFADIAAFSAGLTVLPLRKTALSGGVSGGMELFVLAVLLSYCCVLGLKKRTGDFYEIYSVPFLFAFVIISAATAFFCAAFAPELRSARTALTCVFIAEFIIAATLLNQANISRQSNRRQDIAALTPRNLRLFNISLILPVGLLFAFGFAFRSHIAAAFYFIAEKVSDAVKALLGALISPNTEPTRGTAPTPGEDVGDIPNLSAFWLLILAVYVFGVLFALYKMRRIIWNAVKSALMRLISLFIPKKRGERRSAAFVDYFEDIVYEKRKKRKKTALRTVMRLYGRETRPAEKIRLSYRIFLLRLKKRGANVAPSDTVEAHIALSDGFGELGEYAGIYSKVRYGEETGEDGVAKADEIVRARFI